MCFPFSIILTIFRDTWGGVGLLTDPIYMKCHAMFVFLKKKKILKDEYYRVLWIESVRLSIVCMFHEKID